MPELVDQDTRDLGLLSHPGLCDIAGAREALVHVFTVFEAVDRDDDGASDDQDGNESVPDASKSSFGRVPDPPIPLTPDQPSSRYSSRCDQQ